jgi:hypothetical protein
VFNRAVTFQTVKSGKVVPLERGFTDITKYVLGQG